MRENKRGTGHWRKLKSRMQTALTVISALFLLTGCGAAGSASDEASPAEFNTSSFAVTEELDYEYGYDNYDGGLYATEAKAPENGSSQVPDSATAQSDRKLIRTVDMSVEAMERDYDMFLATLQDQVQSLGGYIENMDRYNGSSYGSRNTRHANLTLRIPKDRLDGFLDMVSDIANVVRRSDSVEDVTLTYVDLASHRNALRTEQERLLELLEQAESVEDILTIENRLSNVRYQLESMESRLRTMDNQVDYSTVYLYVSEVRELTPMMEQTVWERIVYGFTDSLEDIGDGAVNLFVWVAVNLPYLVLWAAFFAVVIIFIRRRWKKSGIKGKKGKAVPENPEGQGGSRA